MRGPSLPPYVSNSLLLGSDPEIGVIKKYLGPILLKHVSK